MNWCTNLVFLWDIQVCLCSSNLRFGFVTFGTDVPALEQTPEDDWLGDWAKSFFTVNHSRALSSLYVPTLAAARSYPYEGPVVTSLALYTDWWNDRKECQGSLTWRTPDRWSVIDIHTVNLNMWLHASCPLLLAYKEQFANHVTLAS